MVIWRKIKEWKIKETKDYVWYGVVYYNDDTEEYRVTIEVRKRSNTT